MSSWSDRLCQLLRSLACRCVWLATRRAVAHGARPSPKTLEEVAVHNLAHLLLPLGLVDLDLEILSLVEINTNAATFSPARSVIGIRPEIQ